MGLACDVKTGTFDPQTTFCRPRIPRSPLKPFFCSFVKKRPGKSFPGLATNQHDKSSSLSFSDSFSK